MVTLKDIARECKVSFSTVSKALKGSPEISIETTEFIQKKAHDMGYHPNIAARSLRTNRTYDIGVIFEDKTGAGFQHQYFATIISGIQKVAFSKGYEMTFVSGDSTKNYDYYSHAMARNYDGLALLSCDFNSSGIQKLIKSEIPTVTLDYFCDIEHAAVMSDYTAGIHELLEFVIAQGHRKIAMVHGEKTWVTDERIAAFKKVCNAHGIEVPPEYFAEGLYHDPVTSSAGTEVFLGLPDPPTCIFYPDDYAALGGIRELNSHGLTPGKDISIVGYDGIALTSMMIPPLTTYEQNGQVIGRTIAEALLAKIENPAEFEPKKEMISGRLIKGGTVVKL